ncbi:DNA polymerase [Neobacillus sp. DY30]|uniref:DNA polymerase n=1 Tax=Neobacillus sp. DY30 TaxID=3047871 RepID=UPI0024C07DFA|nr:DNA polymerase [Neobacillus sp. DY30]WHY01829.1 DNA polymerase [Neobacillus sp. DY30]
MTPKLTLNIKTDRGATERLADAVKKKKAATETAEEAFKRIGSLKLSDKERELFEIAKHTYFSGKIGRLSEGKWNKAEVIEIGRRIVEGREKELRQQRIRETLASKPSNYFILTSDNELPKFIARVREEVAFQRKEWANRFARLGAESMTAGDFEGTGIDAYIDLSIGFSIWLPLLNEGYYLPYGHVVVDGIEYGFKNGDPQLTRSKVLAAIAPYLSHPTHGKTFHMGSARYDLHIALNDGYRIRGCVWDTLDAMHLMNEHEDAYGLKPLTQKYGKAFGVTGTVYTFEDLFGNRSPAPFDTELVGIYAINDVKYGWKLFEWQFEVMQKTNNLFACYCDVDSGLPETDVFMERCGFIIDLERVSQLEAEFEPKIEEAKDNVFSTYKIDAKFIRKMDRTINAKKIQKWITDQKKRITKALERVAAKQAKIAEIELNNKTHTKMYEQEKELLAKYERELNELPEPKIENAPQEITEFSMTNGNHLAYLIYDHLGIKDKTYLVDRSKKRSTAAPVLEMYYADEPSLEPLATVAEYEKLLSTYIRPLLGSGDANSVMEIDGRLHSNFKAGGTATGRYSSSSYNARPIDILRRWSGD